MECLEWRGKTAAAAAAVAAFFFFFFVSLVIQNQDCTYPKRPRIAAEQVTVLYLFFRCNVFSDVPLEGHSIKSLKEAVEFVH